MPLYKCECCDFVTNIKSTYKRHKLSKNHLILLEYKSNPKVRINNYIENECCKYCKNLLKHKKSLSTKYSFQKNNYSKELVLLKLQIQQKDKEIEYYKLQYEKTQTETKQNKLLTSFYNSILLVIIHFFKIINFITKIIICFI